MKKLALLLLVSCALFGQPTSTARRIVHGTTVPSTCSAGDVFFSTTDSSAYVCATANTWVVGASSTGSAPSSATYITKQVESGLSAEQSLGALTTGLVKNMVSAGVGTLSTAVAGTDFVGGQASLTTQYAVPYVSSSGVLANGPLLFQCPSGVVGIGGCTSSYPGYIRSSTAVSFALADNSAYASINALGAYFSGSGRVAGRWYTGLSTVTYSATPTFDASAYNNFKLTLTDNVTSSTLSGASAGQLLVKEICQDATGSRTYVHPANVVNGMTIGSGTSSCSMQLFFFDGTYAQALTPGMVSGKPPVTVSGTSCTITEITNGLITAATCTP